MQITISITAPSGAIQNHQDVLTFQVVPDTTIANLKELIEGHTGLSPTAQCFSHNGEELLDDAKTLQQCLIEDNAILGVLVRDLHATGIQARRNRREGASHAQQVNSRTRSDQQRRYDHAETLRLQALGGDPTSLVWLRQQDLNLANAIHDQSRYHEVWNDLQRQRVEAEYAKQREIALLNEDPFNIEAQTKIEEMIRQSAVMENLENAMSYRPEGFGKVHMLYIDVEVNNHKVKAFVDTGAQATIMSPSCAEKCGILRLMDKRWHGVATGVGTAKILGRVHSAQIKIGSLFLACNFTVMEGQDVGKDVDLMIGLDMLKGHQACIDLQKGNLIIREEQIPFLGEAEIPKHDQILADEPTIAGPSGMEIGAISGAVTQPTSLGPGEKGRVVGEQSGVPTLSSGQQQQGLSPTRTSFPPGDIAQLMDMGFSRTEVLHALEIAGGNVEAAAGYLV